MVMEERFRLSQTDLLLGKDTQLSATDRTEFEKIASRLIQGEPVQYVLGFADFCGHRFCVTPDVLIPRPETEELTRWAMDECLASKSPSSPCHILDLCTGSGCIAISLALALPAARVTAVDISAAALDVARHNAAALGAANVTFVQNDVLISHLSPLISCIVSNPPYVCQSEAVDMSATVTDHEPSLALFVPDEDPLLFYRAIARIGHEVLVPGGRIMVELNAALAASTRQLFVDAGYNDVQLRNDQFGKPRMLSAKR
jgi:release factor glutamine methyltransferase